MPPNGADTVLLRTVMSCEKSASGNAYVSGTICVPQRAAEGKVSK